MINPQPWAPERAAAQPPAPAHPRGLVQIVDAQDGRVRVDPPRRKVVIAAFGRTLKAVHQLQASTEWEIWGLNNGYVNRQFYDREGRFTVDRWFELHPMRVQPQDDATWMRLCPVPIYVLDLKDANPQGPMPHAIRFPLERCESLVTVPGPWWACTFSYQIALALLEGFTTIALLGMDFGSAREWLFERPNVLWWSGFAAGRGVEIVLPFDSTFMRHPHKYGYDYEAEVRFCEAQITEWLDLWSMGDPVVQRWFSKAAVEQAHRIQHAL